MKWFMRWSNCSDGEKADFIWSLFKWYIVFALLNAGFGLFVNGLMWKAYG